MASNEVQHDIEELQMFLESAKRLKVKDVLSIQIRKWQTELVKLAAEEKESQAETNQENGDDTTAAAAEKPVPAKTTTARNIKKDIKTYAWDQSEKFMKLYVDIPGVHKIPEENVTSEFKERYAHLVAANVDNITYQLAVGPLHGAIIPEESKYKVKTDKVLVMLKKKTPETWAYVTKKEDQIKKPPPAMDENKDPSSGLMDMLKQMYDDGDDTMKRTISKAWTQSRDKKEPGGKMDDL